MAKCTGCLGRRGRDGGGEGKGGVDEAEGGMSDEDGRMERGARNETCMEWGRGGLGACQMRVEVGRMCMRCERKRGGNETFYEA